MPTPPLQRTPLLRALDASLNRAAEGARVVEDYARFVLEDSLLTELAKQLRHDLATEGGRHNLQDRLAARDTVHDIGTHIATESESARSGTWDVCLANLYRLQESLRSLEEFSKVLDPSAGTRFEALRYRTYTLAKALGAVQKSLQKDTERLSKAQLYVLLDARDSLAQFEKLAGAVCSAGADIVQFRAKGLEDRELLERARAMTRIAGTAGVLSIINDRPDIALLAHADGVHVGQTELTVQDARNVLGPEAIVGLSTHNLPQLQEALLAGADYVGLGPLFPSTTKPFNEFAGLDYLQEAAATTRLPAFAIGGITLENLSEVLATGVTSVAVGSAVIEQQDPAEAIRRLKRLFG